MPIVVDDVYVDESRPFARFTVRLTEASALPVSVSYNNANETAANGSDYLAQSGTLTFAPGQTVLTIDIPLIGNSTLERAESFLLNLFNPVNTTVATPFARATIVDNDQPAGTPVIRVASQVVDEASGQVSFVVTLDRPSTGSVSVNVATVNGSAVAGSDYVALATQTLTFAPGETVKVVNVALLNDTAAEGREFFDLRLSSPVGATLLPQPTGRTVIGANDAAPVSTPSITVSDAVADESATYLEFVVSLSAPSTQSVSVSYNNANVTASNGSDYLARTSTLTFLPGETTKVVKIPVLDTAGAEPSEMIALNLFNGVNATIGRPLAYGTIVDNDAPSGTPIVRVADQIVDEASGQVSFVIALDRPSTGLVSVNVATANGTAIAGSDFVAPAMQTLTFLPGEMVKVVDVALINDSTAETREFFDLRLSSPVGATLLPQPAGRAFIGANDAAPVAQPLVTLADAVADESGTVLQFVLSLSAPSTQAVSVSYNNANVTASNGSDYLAQTSTLTFAPGETTKVVQIPVLNTAGAEGTEMLALNLFNAVNATIARPLAYGTIVDNDQPSGTPVIRVADRVVDEASGQVHFIVTLDRPSTGNVSVNVATANGSAVAGTDYAALSTQTLTFLPGEMVKVVPVALLNDTAAEAGESFELRLTSPVGATLPDAAARAFIAPNDAAPAALPRIVVSDAVADETGTLEFVVSLSAPSTQAVSVSYNNANLTASNGSDYLAQTSTLTFAPGETTQVVRIPVLNTAGAEATEMLALNLFNAVNATIARPLAIGTLVDNDAASGTPLVSVSDGIVNEGAPRAFFTVTLDRPSTSVVTLNAALSDGNATAGSDYDALPSQPLVFLPGETAKTVWVDLRNDTAAEGPEFFDLTLSGAVNATIADGRGHMVIAQSDAATVAQPVISAVAIAAPEAGTYLEFVVSLSAPSTSAVSVSYNNSNATASNGSDYLAQTSVLTFQPGETVQVVRIPVLNDVTAEATESFNLNLFNPVNGLIGTSTVSGAIIDNDSPPPGSQIVINGSANGDILVGRPGANVVVGSGGNDVLDGVNGVSMSGGSGNDLYIVESASDTLSEGSGAGLDTVVSYVNHTLGANVENLILRGGALNGSGNSLNNTISGNGNANTIDGGAGADAMAAGGGDDVYIVDNAGDAVTEAANAGIDRVQSAVSFTLGANVENLTLTGAGAIGGNGNTLNNTLIGNASANVLNGLAGADMLSGAGGTDTFVFDNSIGGFDTVTDWQSAADTMRFGMAGLPVGDGDAVVENGVVRSASGGFSTAAELVVFTPNIAGAITAASAAAQIGSATSAYAAGAHVLFAVDNGTQTGVFLFQSSAADALVSASELTQVALLNGDATTLGDYVFAP